jgi:hypothetical protein
MSIALTSHRSHVSWSLDHLDSALDPAATSRQYVGRRQLSDSRAAYRYAVGMGTRPLPVGLDGRTIGVTPDQRSAP